MADVFFTDHSIHHRSKKMPYKNYKNMAHAKNIIQVGGLPQPPPPVSLAQIHRRRFFVALPRRCSFHPVCCDSGVEASASKRSNNKPNWMKPAVGWSTPRKTKKKNK